MQRALAGIFLKFSFQKQANINDTQMAHERFDEMTNFNWHIGIFAH